MKLTDLKKGQKAKVVAVGSDGVISRRLMEMGFIKGKSVVLIKTAPFSEPLEYDLDGFKISLRRGEAELIEITLDEKLQQEKQDINYNNVSELIDSEILEEVDFSIALVGNPNCGKTSIFNFATGSKERVANYSGVTVSEKVATMKVDDVKIRVVDLPGTYSLSGQSPDERFVAESLIHNTPDLIINVVDAGNLERNLYLTTQLKETGIKTVIALNMYDELQNDNASLDLKGFETLMGVPVVPTIGKEGKAVKKLFKVAKDYYEKPVFLGKSANLQYSPDIEYAISRFNEKFHDNDFPRSFLLRFYAISLFAEETYLWSFEQFKDKQRELESFRAKILHEKCEFPEKTAAEIVEKRYAYIHSIIDKVYTCGEHKKQKISQKIDAFLTNEVVGLPIFFFFVWLIFFLTFKIGEYPMEWIETGIGALGNLISNYMPPGMLSDLLVKGIIGGVGGVVVFLPNIMILFFMISIMEDSGYMARSAFLMDKFMKRAGLHGKSFIPLMMGFGCNVPAIMATRTIENKRDRILTMMAIPFMSCSARLPVYVLFISAFFPHYESLVLFAIYGIGILVAYLIALLLSRTVFTNEVSPFIMELPPYRMPGAKALLQHTWLKSLHFLKKMGTIILAASIIVWVLSYFPRNNEIVSKYETEIQQLEEEVAVNNENTETITAQIDSLAYAKESELLLNSYISQAGKFIQPIFNPLGFDWKMSVSILTGVMAKEVVVSTMGILYQTGGDEEDTLVKSLQEDSRKNHTSNLTYFAFLVFVLLYFPCFGTIAAIKREVKSWSWIVFSVLFPLVLAWTLSFLIVVIGQLF